MERNEDRTMKGISVKLFFRTSSVPQKTQQSATIRSLLCYEINRKIKAKWRIDTQ